jgi:hypothetical protein
MASWEDDQSPLSSSSKEKQPYLLLRNVPEVTKCSNTGGRRRNVDFEVVVPCIIFFKILFFSGTIYFGLNLCENILWETWRLQVSSIARILRHFFGWCLNIFRVKKTSLKNKSRRRRHSKNFTVLELVTVIGIFNPNTKVSRQNPISFFGTLKNYINSKSITNTVLYFHKISGPPLWMFHLHLTPLKNLNFSSLLFTNNFQFWFLHYSSVVSNFKQFIVVPISTNKFLTPGTRRKLEPNKFPNLTIGLYITDIPFVWFSFPVDGGSRKWWNNQGQSKHLGVLYKYSCLVYEGDVPCGQYMHCCNKDRKHSLFNATKQITFILRVTAFLHLLLWKGNDHHEDMGRIVTAKNRVDKNVRIIAASLLRLCLVMLV